MPSNVSAAECLDTSLCVTSKWGIEEMKLFVSAAIGAVMLVGQAFAATLTVDGGIAGALPSNYDPMPDSTVAGTGVGTSILAFSNAGGVGPGTIVGQGLRLNGDGRLHFTYLGSEAGAKNEAIELSNGQSLGNHGDNNIGDTISADFVDGLVSFKFVTNNRGGGEIENGIGSTMSGLRMAFHVVDSKTVLAFFGDGAGDNDFDDIVIRISTAPLPAGALLLLTGLGGMGIARRRKAKATA